MPVHLNLRETGQGTPLVLLHAFPLSSAMWLSQRESLSDACRVLTPDLRGFGGSPLGEDDPDLNHMADDVAALLDTRGLDAVVLGGLSLGGYVAMAFCRRHLDRVAALVLADTKATADTPEARENRESMARAVLEEGSARGVVDELLPKVLGETTLARRPMVCGRVKGLMQSAPPAAVAWAQRAMAQRPDSTDTLRKVPVPALVVVGEEDTLTPPSESEAMVDGLPDGRLVRLPEVGHLSAIETPEQFDAAVREFVGRLAV
jgi:pimeloyl-ACP methyl ester carboxylesterase